MSALTIRGLRVELDDGREIVDEVDLDLERGSVVALVGESGCGKTTVGLACFNHARPGSTIVAGRIMLGDVDLRSLAPSELRAIAGRKIAYVPQNPATALNPRMRVGTQMVDALRPLQRQHARRLVRGALASVDLPDSDTFLKRYPHELSGGQIQRILIAMAVSTRPDVIVLDEPTTGLDVTTQAGVLEVIRQLRRESDLAMLYVSHDQAVIANLADRVVVMYAGRAVETAPLHRLFARPYHPYTRQLLQAVPRKTGSARLVGIPGDPPAVGDRPNGCSFHLRCQHAESECAVREPTLEDAGDDRSVRCLRWATLSHESQGAQASTREPNAPADGEAILVVDHLVAGYSRNQMVLHDASFALTSGRTLGIVGQSGSGKTTLGRAVAGLHRPMSGSIWLNGKELQGFVGDRDDAARAAIQIIFQNPGGSLNPRHRVTTIIGRPLRTKGLGGAASAARIAELLSRVQLPSSTRDRYPGELSGGEQQRVAIARALASDPAILICDEITSALDVSVQAAIVELLRELQAEFGMSLLFISHDLALVRSLAESVLVLEAGHVRDYGSIESIFDGSGRSSYTGTLLDAIPEIPAFQLDDPKAGVTVDAAKE